MPVFNEEQLLRENMERLLQFCRDQNFRLEWRIVILLNGCTDNSLSIAHCLSKEYPEIFYVNRKEGGKGRALSQYWKDSASDILFYMDIDLAVSLKHIPEFLESLKDNDLVVGSRLLPDSKVERSFIRGISSKGFCQRPRIVLSRVLCP